MSQNERDVFTTLSTPMIADACIRLCLPVRAAPPGIQPIAPTYHAAGTAFPVSHHGSVDIFLEAITAAPPQAVLVIDNGGRLDEGCVGDLIALEAKEAGLTGMVVWGVHRDTSDLISLDFPIFSYGSFAVGPQRLEAQPPNPFAEIRFGPHKISQNDFVFADRDGVLFVDKQYTADVLAFARDIRDKERRQAELMRQGKSLRQQLLFEQYLKVRRRDSTYTFREHITKIGGAVE